VNIALQYIVRW